MLCIAIDCTERAIPSPYSEMISLGIRSSQDLSVINRYGHSKGSRVETSASYETSSRHSRFEICYRMY